MSARVHPSILSVLAAAALLPGCAFNTQQRTENSAEKPVERAHIVDRRRRSFLEQYDGEHSKPSNPTSKPGKLAEYVRHSTSYIEFDEQGDFWDRRQLTSAIEDIRACKRPVILVIYAHGWENHSQSDDVWRFNDELLQRISESPHVGPHYDVRGVYLAWNGKRLHNHAPEPFHTLFDAGQIPTFWGRKNAASNRVAGTCATEAILSLAKTAREQNDRSKIVMIGHSFGALVMERAVAPGILGAMMFQEIKNHGSKGVILPADLILLLNSAAESIYAKQMIDFFHANPQEFSGGSFISRNRPLIISVTSHADWTTGWPFGIGTTVSNTISSFRDYKTPDGTVEFGQRHFLTHTAAHSDVLLSHDVISVPKNDPLERKSAFDENLERPKQENIFATEPGPMADGPPRWWQVKELTSKDQSTAKYNDTPYWVVRSPAEICHGHTDVWNANMVDMMAALFRLAQPDLATGPTRMTIRTVPKGDDQRQPRLPAHPMVATPTSAPIRLIPEKPAAVLEVNPTAPGESSREKKRARDAGETGR